MYIAWIDGYEDINSGITCLDTRLNFLRTVNFDNKKCALINLYIHILFYCCYYCKFRFIHIKEQIMFYKKIVK